MNETELRRRAAKFVERPYLKIIHGEPDEGFLGEVPELPGCFTAGETEAEALENLREAMTSWIMTALDDGAPIPEPACGVDADSGLLVRLPEPVTKRLRRRARDESLSCEQLAANLLTQSLS